MVPATSDKNDAFIKKLKLLNKTVEYICNVSNAFGYKTRRFILKVFCKYWWTEQKFFNYIRKFQLYIYMHASWPLLGFFSKIPIRNLLVDFSRRNRNR